MKGRKKLTEMSEEEKDSAARLIGKSYREYLQAKKKSVRKDYKLKEKKELFLNVDPKKTPVLFKQKGTATLFPTDKKTKQVKLNLPLVKYYIDKGIDIRPYVLEAHLNGRIDKNTLLSLFLLQQGVIEFYGNAKLDKKTSLQIFKIHADEKLTKDAQEKLLPYLENTSPSQIFKNKEKFQDTLAAELKSLPETDNFFALVEISLNDIYKITYNLIKDDEFGEKHLSAPLAKSFFTFVAKSLGETNFDANNSKLALQQLKFGIMDKLENKLIKILAEEKVKIKKIELATYMEKHLTLFDLLVETGMQEIGEFTPLASQEGKDIKFHLPIIGSKTQNAWLKAITGKNPEEVLTKVLMFGTIPVRVLHDLVQRRARPIGLEYEGLETPDLVHYVKSKKAYAYSGHDLRFHYEVLFYLLVYAPYIFELQLKVAQAIRETTKQPVAFPVVNILDFANGEFIFRYDENKSVYDTLMASAFIPTTTKDTLPAMLEYTFIIACDIFKHEQVYVDVFKPLADQAPTQEDLIAILLAEHEIDPQTILAHKEILKTFSTSLAAFMCMLIVHDFDSSEMIALCNKIHKLEQQGDVIFKWNQKDGMMFNIDKTSFRFRYPGETGDYRLGKTYPEDGLIRKNSNEANWWRDLNHEIELKMRHIHSAKI